MAVFGCDVEGVGESGQWLFVPFRSRIMIETPKLRPAAAATYVPSKPIIKPRLLKIKNLQESDKTPIDFNIKDKNPIVGPQFGLLEELNVCQEIPSMPVEKRDDLEMTEWEEEEDFQNVLAAAVARQSKVLDWRAQVINLEGAQPKIKPRPKPSKAKPSSSKKVRAKPSCRRAN